jgi:uncharacterized membrane protein YphA (DoxX/SURF4 family)
MEQTISLSPRWSQGSMIAFRFAFSYFIFYIFPFPLNILSQLSTVFQPLAELSNKMYQPLAAYVMGTDYKLPAPNGSGDTVLNYMQFFVGFIFSIVATIIWSFVDRKRDSYEKLLQLLIIVLRYYLAFWMIGYGFAKVFKMQFPSLTTDRLYNTYGESSPMGLLWTFMGYSTVYNIFTGLWEVIAGVFLLFKRTRLIGVLLVIAIMSNVVMLNFAYDVPVKLFSTHLLLMAFVLIGPDIKRLLNLFFFNRPVAPETSSSLPFNYGIKTKLYYNMVKWSAVLLIFATNGMFFYIGSQQQIAFDENQKRYAPVMGEFEVETFVLNGDVIPPGQLDTRRWKKIWLKQRTVDIQYMDGGSGPWHCNRNATGSKIILHSLDLWSAGSFSLRANGESFTLEGKLNQDSLKLALRKVGENQFLLVNRGFNWVNDYPFNR